LAKDTQIIGASADPPKDNKAWSDMYGFPFPLICDEGRDLQKKFGGDVRWAILINKDHTVEAFCAQVGNTKYTFAEEMLSFIPEPE